MFEDLRRRFDEFHRDADGELNTWYCNISKRVLYMMGPTKRIEQRMRWVANNTKWSPKFFGIKTKSYSIGFVVSK